MIALVLVIAAVAFTLSASAGLGGSLLLVPAMSLLLGPKEGIALAAMLLAANNMAKVVVYRRVIPLRSSALVLLLTVVGAALGAQLLVGASADFVSAAIIASVAASFLLERRHVKPLRSGSASVLAFASGATSGFSGTSGPLKGLALRALDLDRRHFVGAASAVSLAGDATKVALFSHASLLPPSATVILLCALPLMPLAALLGRHLNQEIGERGYAALFWTVIVGYSIRLAVL